MFPRTLNTLFNFSQVYLHNDKIPFVSSISKDWTAQQDTYGNVSQLQGKYKASCPSARRDKHTRSGHITVQVTPTRLGGCTDCPILCCRIHSPFGQKTTDTRGNPKSQVLFQKQKTDGYKKDNQAQFKRLERMERKILMPKL